jgi:long-chain acyl-CoA synthetase
MTVEFGLSQQDRVLLGGSLANSFFLTGALHGLSIGAKVICLDKFSPGRLIAAARRSRATVLYLVPTMSRRLADRLEREPPLDSIQVVIAAGARWLPADRRRLQELLPWARLIEYYGSSEMGFVSISTPAKFEAEPQSVGRIFSGVEVEIRDDEGRFCGPNQLGTIHARGPFACAGLLGEAAELASPSSPAWLSSGDRGYLDERGCLFLVGREDEQINVGGLKLFAPEIEREILGHPDVSAAIVLGLDDPLQGQVVGALVESRAGRRPLESEILAWLRPRLSSHKLPRRLLVVSRLPRTPNGKAARARARALLSASNPTTGAP